MDFSPQTLEKFASRESIMVRILIADDHPLFRQALRAVISRNQPQIEIMEAETLAGARAILAREQDVVAVLLDLKMSDCGEFSSLLSLRGEFPEIPVAVVSSSSDTATISGAMAFGAAGFIPKSSAPGEIAKAVAAVLEGEIWLPEFYSSVPVSTGAQSIASLTPAQLQILMGLQRGLRNKEIAYEMGVTEKTVKAYMTAMFRKLGVSSRTQALIAMQSLSEADSLKGQS